MPKEEEDDIRNDPTHTAYSVRNYGTEGKSDWKPLGKAWPHKDGNGFDVIVESVPLNGRIVLRDIEAEKQAKGKAKDSKDAYPKD